MGQSVSCDDQPGAIALFMVPELAVPACWIVAQVLIFVKLLRGIGCLPIGAVDERGVPEVDKFCGITRAEQRVIDEHVRSLE